MPSLDVSNLKFFSSLLACFNLHSAGNFCRYWMHLHSSHTLSMEVGSEFSNKMPRHRAIIRNRYSKYHVKRTEPNFLYISERNRINARGGISRKAVECLAFFVLLHQVREAFSKRDARLKGP